MRRALALIAQASGARQQLQAPLGCSCSIIPGLHLQLAAASTQAAGISSTSHTSETSQRAYQTQPADEDDAESPTTSTSYGYAQTDAAYDPGSRGRPGLRPLVFSIRPSATSPLHALYKENQQLQERLRFLSLTLQAHEQLQYILPSKENTTTTLARREAELSDLKASLQQLSAAQGVYFPPPEDPADMYAYYAVLTSRLQERDAAALEFKRVLNGESNVWEYWFDRFAPSYRGLPTIGSLEKIYNPRPAISSSGSLVPAGNVSSSSGASTAGAAAAAAAAAAAVSARRTPKGPHLDAMGRAAAVGRRKTSTAKVYLWAGEGRILVNKKPVDDYFRDLVWRSALLQPLLLTNTVGKVDIVVQVRGGGLSGQAQAAAHGIARALLVYDPRAYGQALRTARLLRRDPRMVERKKPGKAKARKSFTWVKR